MRGLALTVLLLLHSASVAAQSAQEAPLSLKDIQGHQLRLADYKGKVVLINFWATWCIPCRTEIPDLIKMQKEYHPQGSSDHRHNLSTREDLRSAAFCEKARSELSRWDGH